MIAFELFSVASPLFEGLFPTNSNRASRDAISAAARVTRRSSLLISCLRLDRAKPNVPRTNRDFWLIYAQLSQFVARYDDSIATYKYLLEAEKPEIDDLANLIGLLQAAYPIEAARMAEHGSKQNW